MTATISKTKFNETLECVRMIAAVFVVFIHVPFPGEVGIFATCLARFAVPFFFAVSGYFCIGSSRQQVFRRMKNILKLNLLAIGIMIASDSLLTAFRGGNLLEKLRYWVPTLSDLGEWFFLHINPFGGHLWYLTAIGVCYGVWLIYRGFFGEEAPDYRTLYLTGFFLFLVRFALADVMTVVDMQVPYYLYRDGLFLGIPMFALGLFLGQYQQRIWDNYRLTTGKLVGLLIFGILLSLFQEKAFSIHELPMGAVVQVVALLLMTARNPHICGSSRLAMGIVSQFRSLSTWVYILHLPVNDFYKYLLRGRFEAVFGSREAWVQPIAVLGITVGICLVAQLAGNVLHRKEK